MIHHEDLPVSACINSVTQSCLTSLSMPGFPIHHQLLEPAQTHAHQVGDDIQPSYPLSSPSPPAFNLAQHQSLFQWVSSLHWSFSFSISPPVGLYRSITFCLRFMYYFIVWVHHYLYNHSLVRQLDYVHFGELAASLITVPFPWCHLPSSQFLHQTNQGDLSTKFWIAFQWSV